MGNFFLVTVIVYGFYHSPLSMVHDQSVALVFYAFTCLVFCLLLPALSLFVDF